ncbi:MAG: SDR family oxidoreductase [Parvularculaceae bacterium]
MAGPVAPFAVLITGCNGGIGRALVEVFAADGWRVVGVDRHGAPASGDGPGVAFVGADLEALCDDDALLSDFAAGVRAAADGAPLKCIVNNAATQILAPTEELTRAAFVSSIKVNTVAPFLLAKTFLSDLAAVKGSIINIGSVHAEATKPEFAAYATSKAALHGLTRALAVDLGPDVRVNTLAPAATATQMLKAGFENNPAGFAELEKVHPIGRIADPAEIAGLAKFLASDDAAFVTGATLYADGGVLSRLHDPA